MNAQPNAPLFKAALRDTRNAPCTPRQRLYIRTLMDRVAIDSYFATLMHRRFFDGAGLTAPTPGAHLDGVLEALTCGQASALIGQLQNELSDEVDE